MIILLFKILSTLANLILIKKEKIKKVKKLSLYKIIWGIILLEISREAVPEQVTLIKTSLYSSSFLSWFKDIIVSIFQSFVRRVNVLTKCGRVGINNLYLYILLSNK